MKKLFYSFIIIFSMMFLYKTSSFASQDTTFGIVCYGPLRDNPPPDRLTDVWTWQAPRDSRWAIYYTYTPDGTNVNYSFGTLSNYRPDFYTRTRVRPDGDIVSTHPFSFTQLSGHTGVYHVGDTYNFASNSNIPVTFTGFGSIYVASSQADAINYIETGEISENAFLVDLELDSFDVWSYGVRDSLDNYSIPEYSNIYEVKWSDQRITTVKVRIDSVLQTQDFVSQTSPYKNYFRAGDYADVNGDVITLTATPYTSDGHYGVSMYYSFTYDGNNLVTNILRKFIKNKHYDNTIEIPFNGVDKTYDVDGVTTNNVYKVYYNPETNEYNNFELYEIVYSPIIVYPYETPAEEITDTQTVVNNNYVTNNYYETTQNINVGFDFNFDDVSAQEVQDTYDEIGGFFDGFGVVVGRLVDLLTALFPFLSPAVAAFILAGFALIVTLGIIALVIKIASIIADFIPL